MGRSRFLGWQLLILILGSIALCHGTTPTPVGKVITKRDVSTTGTAAPSSPSGLISPEDEDVFVPYQGERFSVFDWNICKRMATKYRGNLLISPLSMKLALVLLYEGAQDQTAHELAGVMHLPVGRWATRDKFSIILRSLRPVFNEFELNFGTRMYIDSSITPTQSYAAILKSFYEADVVPIDFANPRNTVTEINNWVSNVTRNNIEKLVDDERSVQGSVMMVMNAMYFKGSWHKNRFSANDTKIGKFYTSPNTTIDVPFMNTEGNFYYSESVDLDAKILRIPYVGHKFAMYFVLPRTKGGVDELVKNINPFALTRQIWLMQNLNVEVKIPKFKFDFTSHLEPTLREMGIRDIFDDTASLNGIAHAKRTAQRLVVSSVIQKSGIEVNERGTTTYATTAVNIVNKMDSQQFIADHPFLFFIEDEITGTILTMGRMSNPLEQTGSTENENTQTTNRLQGDGSTSLPTAVPSGISDATRNNFFNAELLQAINEENDGNAVVSPLSVKAALTALLEGTGGRTRQELITTLRLPFDVTEIRNVVRDTLVPFQDPQEGTEVTLATRVWVNMGLQVSINYKNALEHYYNGDIRSVQFRDTANAARAINEWVRLATKNNIQNIVGPNSLTQDTLLLLTSALYFKGRWLKAFDEAVTTSRCFKVPNRGCQDTRMMENVSKYNYGVIPSLNAAVAELPYADGRMSMLVFLPRNEGIASLHTLSKDISVMRISDIFANLRETELLVSLPKFSIESKFDLRPILERMGIKDLFDLSANVSGILPGTNARVGSVLHNAKVEVNEVGTVAAAFTGISIVPLMGTTFESFRVDRPFLFAIVDRPTSNVLFAGRVVQPERTTA